MNTIENSFGWKIFISGNSHETSIISYTKSINKSINKFQVLNLRVELYLSVESTKLQIILGGGGSSTHLKVRLFGFQISPWDFILPSQIFWDINRIGMYLDNYSVEFWKNSYNHILEIFSHYIFDKWFVFDDLCGGWEKNCSKNQNPNRKELVEG